MLAAALVVSVRTSKVLVATLSEGRLILILRPPGGGGGECAMSRYEGGVAGIAEPRDWGGVVGFAGPQV